MDLNVYDHRYSITICVDVPIIWCYVKKKYHTCHCLDRLLDIINIEGNDTGKDILGSTNWICDYYFHTAASDLQLDKLDTARS